MCNLLTPDLYVNIPTPALLPVTSQYARSYVKLCAVKYIQRIVRTRLIVQ